ncbi:MAG: hypothetical protein P8M32_00920 [Phycisphaerales bacterium]|nr:hypothetical protein [Phycisphaerales bacterium]
MFAAGTLLVSIVLAADAGRVPVDTITLLDRFRIKDKSPPLGQPWLSKLHRQSVMALANGREAELSGNVALAFEAYRDAVSADRNNEAAWLGLARLGRAVNDRSLEMEAWKQRLVLCPRDADALHVMATSALRSHRDDEALSLLLRRRAVPSHDSPLEMARWDAALGVQLMRVGETKTAEELVAAARATLMPLAVSSPGNSRERHRWSLLLQQLVTEGSRPLARELAAARLAGNALTNRGDRGRFASTCIAIDAADGNTERTIELIRNLPQTDLRLKTHFREALTPAEMWTHASTIHATLGNTAGAMVLLEEAIKRDENLPLALNNLGYMLLEQGLDQSRAAGMIEEAWERDPESPANLDSLGWLRLDQGRLADDPAGRGALSLLREAARRSDQLDPVILEHLGDAESQAGESESARRTWRHALSVLSHPEFEKEKLRTFDLIQSGDWGIRVTSSRDLYDLEFGTNADRLRAKLGVEDGDAN